MNGIFYFSATGNSLYIAKRIKEALGGCIRYIPKSSGCFDQFSRIIVVTPIYAFALPYNVYGFLKSLPKDIPVDIVLNYGGATFGCEKTIMGYVRSIGLKIQSIHSVRMPINFTVLVPIPKSMINKEIKKAPINTEKIIEKLKTGKAHLPNAANNKENIDKINKFSDFSKAFTVNEKCVGCGKCSSICPTDNINIIDGKAVFSNNCVACLACYHRCKNKAITSKNRNDDFRYVNPEIEESDIGKDFD